MLPIQMKKTENPNTYLQNFDKRLDMGKHPFILVITIYFLHVVYILLSFNRSKCALDNRKINKQVHILFRISSYAEIQLGLT